MPDRHDPAQRIRNRWYWSAPYAAVVVFAIVMLALVWLLQAREENVERGAVTRDVQWMEQMMRMRMRGTEEFLAQLARELAAGTLDFDVFRLRASQYITSNGGLVSIAWVGPDQTVRWAAPFSANGWSEGAALAAGQLPPFSRAGALGQPAYGQIHAAQPENTVLEVYVPVRDQHEFRGAIVGVYSVERMLQYLVPAWFAEKYRLALRGPQGETLAVNSALSGEDEGIAFDIPLDPPGNGLVLRAAALNGGGHFPLALPVALILGLSVIVFWTLWLLRTHLLRRIQVERERDRLFNLSLDMLCIISLDGVFLRCNPAFERILGYPPEQLAGKSLIDLVHEDDTAATLAQLYRLTEGEPASFENRCRCQDGAHRWLVWSINPVQQEERVYAVAHDITARKAAEQALQAESAFRKAMEQSVLTGLRAIDETGRIIYVNSAFCRMVGFEESELLGIEPPFPYWPPEEMDACRSTLELSLSGQSPPDGFDMPIRRKNGERIEAHFYLSPLIDLNGRQTGWLASVTDVTEQRRVRAALEAAHERFEAVLDGLDSAVFVADARTDEILFANRTFKYIHGFDAVGRTVRGVAAPQPERTDYRFDPRLLSAADLPRELFDGELQHLRSGRWYYVREHATRWVDGRVVRMGIATDITARKQTEETARQQEEQLERTARLVTMGEMASTLAHELNQPLAAISNYCAGCITRMQSAGWKPEDVSGAMQKAQAQAERAGKIIRNIREFVKKSEPHRSAVRITDIIDSALAFAEIDARRLGARIVSETAPELPAVFADRVMIEQVVLNLVRNGLDAMESTPAAQRVLTVRARTTSAHTVEVAVADRGCGIGEEERTRLFMPFYTTKPEGMGMGLNICRTIVEFHDGRLVVDTNPEGGTIFAFTLPTEAASGQQETSHDT